MKNNNVKVSVIIPVYNVEKYLGECLDSLINQTLKDIEIICVDDGSDDRSLEILNHYAKIDERVIVLQQKNQYAGVARNNGLKIAKGEYVVFLDSDDFFDKRLLQKAYLKGVGTGADVVLYGGVCYDVATEQIIQRKDYLHRDFLPENEVFSRKDIPDRIFGVSTLSPWTKMFRREFVLNHKLQFQPLPNSNDVYFVMCGMAFAEKISYVNADFVYYRIGQSANLQSRKSKSPLCFMDAYEAVYDTLTKAGIFDEVKKSYVTALVSSAVYNMDTAKASEEFSQTETWIKIMDRITGDFAKKINILECPDDYYGNRQRIAKLRGYEYAVNWYKKHNAGAKKVETLTDKRELNQPKVSVVIPVYNTELYLKPCLDSIANQTLKDIEIICVNDGSKDNSLDILQSYAKKDKRFCIINQENSGQAAARNHALKTAKGEYLYCMDSDDILSEDALKVLYENAQSRNLDILYFDGDCFSDSRECAELVKENNNRYSRRKSYDDVYTGERLMAEMRLKEEYQVSPCLQIMKRSFFEENNLWFEEGILHEDELFTYKSMLTAQRTSHINEKLFHRRYRQDSVMTSSTSFANVYGYFHCYLKMCDFTENLDLSYDCEAVVLEILGSRLTSARNKFQMLTEEERWTYLGLSPLEQTKFKLYMMTAAKNVVNDKTRELEREINRLKNSYSMKVGLTLVYPLSRLKTFIQQRRS